MGTGLKEPLQGDQDLSLVSIKQIVVQELIISLSLFIHAMLITVKCMYIVHCRLCVVLTIRI